ncbi:hypothetical protein [Heliophilum fasciatum]|uniref:Uncharacterized protein n=1 Tax=Heliophilum fasciatum TaxID=35700 RepID=A0A4R2REH1_9FIRM|nr:hypothetical protein [Heliophilum fasciatum]MCW2279138.1 hypothetical protein [Heliophilum fasciatum]TCP61223.1 hypothetical protein EDD73_13015 [Heliophilum fasciatum]
MCETPHFNDLEDVEVIIDSDRDRSRVCTQSPSLPSPPVSEAQDWLLFAGVPQVPADAKEGLLFDGLAPVCGRIIKAIQVTFAQRQTIQSAQSAMANEGELFLYIDDLLLPAVVIPLADFRRKGRRPLNVRSRTGQVKAVWKPGDNPANIGEITVRLLT